MASRSIQITTMFAGLALILATELLGFWTIKGSNIPSLVVLGLVRLLQITGLGWLVIKQEGGLAAIGLAPETWMAGCKKGAVWSMGFGAVAFTAMAVIYATGINPLQMIRSTLPSKIWEISLYFLVGGMIAPVAEEICFRGIFYTYFRRWGILVALAASTAIFVPLHSTHGIPIVQIVGSVVLAIAYETSGNLMVPIIIHGLANLAIFTLSLL